LLFLDYNVTGIPNTLSDPGAPFMLDDDRVPPPLPLPPAPPPALPEGRAADSTPVLHVLEAVNQGRQSTNAVGAQTIVADIAGRSSGQMGEGISTQKRLDALIDKFDRVTDPNLFVLPQVKDTRSQSSDAKAPTIELQSGILFEPTQTTGALPDIFVVASADAELDRVIQAQAEPQSWWQAALQQEKREREESDSTRLRQWLAAMAPVTADATEPTVKSGKQGFSAKLKAAARQVLRG
jgi:hypothetical protein